MSSHVAKKPKLTGAAATAVAISSEGADVSLPSARIPSGFSAHRFSESIMGPDRAQDPRNELWLFQLPPELTSADLVTANVTIPTSTVVPHQAEFLTALAAGDSAAAAKAAAAIPAGNTRLASFTLKSIAYVLYESPARDAEHIINLWTTQGTASDGDEFEDEDGNLIRGKPFVRFFVVLPSWQSKGEKFALAPISGIPKGWNTGVGEVSHVSAIAAGPAAAAVSNAGRSAIAAAAAGAVSTSADAVVGGTVKAEKSEKKAKKDKKDKSLALEAAAAAAAPAPAAPAAAPAAMVDEVDEAGVLPAVKKEKKEKKDKKDKKDAKVKREAP